MVVFPTFFPNKRRRLCFVINVLNTKEINLLNLAEYRLFTSEQFARNLRPENVVIFAEINDGN